MAFGCAPSCALDPARRRIEPFRHRFASPTSGRTAIAAREGLQVRAGLHVGEVEHVGNGVRGMAVHEAARIMAVARPDEILVSETTRVLATAAGLTFEDRGLHELKGLPAPSRLFAYVGGEVRVPTGD